MKFKVISVTPVMDTQFGDTFEYEEGTPADPANPESVPYNWEAWVSTGLVEVVEGPTSDASASTQGD